MLLDSLVPRPFPPPVFYRILYAKTGGGNGLGTRLRSSSPRVYISCSGEPGNEATDLRVWFRDKFAITTEIFLHSK